MGKKKNKRNKKKVVAAATSNDGDHQKGEEKKEKESVHKKTQTCHKHAPPSKKKGGSRRQTNREEIAKRREKKDHVHILNGDECKEEHDDDFDVKMKEKQDSIPNGSQNLDKKGKLNIVDLCSGSEEEEVNTSTKRTGRQTDDDGSSRDRKSPPGAMFQVKKKAEHLPNGVEEKQKRGEKSNASISSSDEQPVATSPSQSEQDGKKETKSGSAGGAVSGKKKAADTRKKKNDERITDSGRREDNRMSKKRQQEDESSSGSSEPGHSSSDDEHVKEERVDEECKRKKTKLQRTAIVNNVDQGDESSSRNESEDEDEDEDEDAERGSKDGRKFTKRGEDGQFFSDENKEWLKPAPSSFTTSKRGTTATNKKQIISSSEDEEEDMAEGDEVSGNDEPEDEQQDDEDLLEVERESKRLDEEMRKERLDAEEEMRHTIKTQTSTFHLPTENELEDEEDRVVPPSEIRRRIQDVLEVLADFKNRREAGRSRSEYLDRLRDDMSELYGYIPELVQLFLDHFGHNETMEFIEASEQPRPLVIRTNTLRIRRKDLASSLLKRGVNLDPLASWSKVGLKIYDSPVPIGATPEYLAGHYMLQSAASMCPVMALAPQPKERILDVASAPGGKTSHIAQLMKNTGIIVANDLRVDRQKATIANMHRLGVRNAIVCHSDGRKLGTKMKSSFHRVLLDSPCSGLGIISRDSSVKVQRTLKDIQKTVVLQKELILSAVDALKVGGTLVYSTCSICIHENEEVVNYLLGKRDVKVVDAGLEFGKPGFIRYQQKRFHPSLALTRRFYPHVHNMDGFYVAKIHKLSDSFTKAAPVVNQVEEETADAYEVTKKEEKLEAKGDHAEDSGSTEKIGVNGKDGGKAKLKKKQKGTRNKNGDEKVKRMETNRAKKLSKIVLKPKPVSAPPKKKSTNAKVTKPRRKKPL